MFLLDSDENESMSTVLSLGAEFQVLEVHGLEPVVTNFFDDDVKATVLSTALKYNS